VTPRLRLLLLVAAVAAIWWARQWGNDDLVAGARGPRGKSVAAPPADLCTTPAVLPERSKLVARGTRDPFTGENTAAVAAAPRARVTPPAPVVTVAALPPPPPPPPQAPPAPRVPYRFVGLLQEKGTASSVFLGLGPALIAARRGDTLDGGFRLDEMTTRELTFTHLATQKTVRMAIEGETP
jgi:hypothetical protein